MFAVVIAVNFDGGRIMKKFETPMMDIQRFNAEDTISTSGCSVEAFDCSGCYCVRVDCDETYTPECSGCFDDVGDI